MGNRIRFCDVVLKERSREGQRAGVDLPRPAVLRRRRRGRRSRALIISGKPKGLRARRIAHIDTRVRRSSTKTLRKRDRRTLALRPGGLVRGVKRVPLVACITQSSSGSLKAVDYTRLRCWCGWCCPLRRATCVQIEHNSLFWRELMLVILAWTSRMGHGLW